MKYTTSIAAMLVGLSSAAQSASVESDIYQFILTDVPVEQELFVSLPGDNQGSPNFSFEDPDSGDIVFPNFENFFAADGDFAEVLFDQSLLPNTPPAFDPVFSNALLTGAWTFDASVLDQDLTGFTDEEGTTVGTQSLNSSFQALIDGQIVSSGVTSTTDVIVANNVFAGTDDDGNDVTFDLLALVAGRTPGFDFDPSQEGSSGVTLVVAGGANWFEDAAAAGEIPDFENVLAGVVELEAYYYGDTDGDGIGDFPLFEERILGELTEETDFVANPLGSGEGLSENNPVLPTNTVTEDENGNELPNPIFQFDLSEAERIELPGVPGGIVFIDPEIAVGYTYTLEGAGEITGIIAPTLAEVDDPDGYIVTINGISFEIAPGEYVAFADVFDNAGETPTPVTEVILEGISIGAMLDPTDDMAFVAGLSIFGDDSTSFVSQQAIIEDVDFGPNVSAVPVPAGLPLMLAGVGVLGWMRYRRKSH